MLIPFIVTALLLALVDIMELKKNMDKKSTILYVAFMLCAIALCVWFTGSDTNHSLSDMLMALFNIQG